MAVFYEKLNVKENKEPYQIEEEITMQSGRYEDFLRHDNVIESSIALYTDKKLTGEKVENFVLSVDENYPWRTFIRVSSTHEKLYLSYETVGDVIEADDINDLQKAVMKLEKDVASVDTSAFVTSEEFNRLKQSSLESKTAHIQAIEGKTGQSSGLAPSSSWRDILYFWSNVVSSNGGTELNFAQLFLKIFEFEKSFWQSGNFDTSSLTTLYLNRFFKNVQMHKYTVNSSASQMELQTSAKILILIFKQKEGFGSSANLLKFNCLPEKFQVVHLGPRWGYDLAKDNAVRLESASMYLNGLLSEDMEVYSDRFLYIFPASKNRRTYNAAVSWLKTEGEIYVFETDGFL